MIKMRIAWDVAQDGAHDECIRGPVFQLGTISEKLEEKLREANEWENRREESNDSKNRLWEKEGNLINF